MREKTTYTLVLLTFLGMVGIYIGAYLAYQKYQQYQTAGGGLSGLMSLYKG